MLLQLNGFFLNLLIVDLFPDECFAEGGLQGHVHVLAWGSLDGLVEEDVVQVLGREDLMLVVDGVAEGWQLAQTLVAAVCRSTLLLQGEISGDMRVILLEAWTCGVELCSHSRVCCVVGAEIAARVDLVLAMLHLKRHLTDR